MTTTPVKSSVDFPLSQATEELTGFEMIAIEKRYGRLDSVGLGQLTCGLVWAFENRTSKTSWQEIEGRTQRELAGYFAPEPDEPIEPDEDDPKG